MTELAKGISLYPGLDHSLEENLERLRTAAGMGISRLFLSFHIPETDPAAFGATVQPLLRAAREWGMETVGDLVPGNPVPETGGLGNLRRMAESQGAKMEVSGDPEFTLSLRFDREEA